MFNRKDDREKIIADFKQWEAVWEEITLHVKDLEARWKR